MVQLDVKFTLAYVHACVPLLNKILKLIVMYVSAQKCIEVIEAPCMSSAIV